MTDYQYYQARDQIVPDMRANADPEVLAEKAAFGLGISKHRAAEFVERVLTDLSHHVDRAVRTMTRPK